MSAIGVIIIVIAVLIVAGLISLAIVGRRPQHLAFRAQSRSARFEAIRKAAAEDVAEIEEGREEVRPDAPGLREDDL